MPLVEPLRQWDPASHHSLRPSAPDWVDTALPLGRVRQVTLTRVMPPGALALEDGRVVVVLDDPGRLPTLKTLRVLFDAPLVACMPWQDSVRRFIPIACGVRDIGGSGVGWFG